MAAATQKNRIVTCGEPANERPVADLGLGDESRWASGINCENVQPGDVVGNDEAAARGVAWGVAWGAARDAALATLARDLITGNQYDLLMAPWRTVIGDQA